MWVQVSITVGEETVGLEVKRLEPDDRARAAASIAWLTYMALESGADADAAVWPWPLRSMVGAECYRIQGCDGRQLSDAWWNEAGRRAAAEFVLVNELAGTLRRFHEGLSRSGVSPRQGLP